MNKFKQWLIPGPRAFVSASTAAKYCLKVRSKRKVTALANGDSLVTSGTAKAKIKVNQKTYQVVFTVAKHLVADVILGLDVLRQHHSVRLELGGDRPETVICAGLNELAFPATKIAPSTIFSNSVYSGIPIATNRVVTNRKTSPSWNPRLTACSLRA